MSPRRGEIWWVRQPPGTGQATDESTRRRPYLVVSGNPWNLEPSYPRITICPLTGREHVLRRYDTDVVLKKKETGLPKDSVVRCVEIYTVFDDCLIAPAGRVSDKSLRKVEKALKLYLSLQ